MRFEKPFDSYVCHGDTISVNHEGFRFTARIEHDPFASIDDDDCHNPDQTVTGCNQEQQRRLLAAREGWKRDEWFYCGIVISAIHIDTGATWEGLESLWRIEANYPESSNTYLTEVANELLANAVDALKDKLVELSRVFV
jgi:hypothetical protein